MYVRTKVFRCTRFRYSGAIVVVTAVAIAGVRTYESVPLYADPLFLNFNTLQYTIADPRWYAVRHHCDGYSGLHGCATLVTAYRRGAR